MVLWILASGGGLAYVHEGVASDPPLESEDQARSAGSYFAIEGVSKAWSAYRAIALVYLKIHRNLVEPYALLFCSIGADQQQILAMARAVSNRLSRDSGKASSNIYSQFRFVEERQRTIKFMCDSMANSSPKSRSRLLNRERFVSTTNSLYSRRLPASPPCLSAITAGVAAGGAVGGDGNLIARPLLRSFRSQNAV